MAKMINPFCDEGFKRIFGDKILLIDFLNSFATKDNNITDLTYENKEIVSELDEGRSVIFDLYCRLKSGEYVIIEMQNCRQTYFVNRAVYYLSKSIASQGIKGRDWKFDIKAVIGIYFTQFKVFNNDDVLYEMGLINPKRNEVVSDKIRGFFIQLPNFNKDSDSCNDQFDKWIYNLKNMENMGTIAYKDQEVFDRLWDLSNDSKLTPSERNKYERSLKAYRDYVNQIDYAMEEGIEKGLKQGREEGLKQGREEMLTSYIMKFRNKGKTTEEISDLLDIPLDEVIKVINE